MNNFDDDSFETAALAMAQEGVREEDLLWWHKLGVEEKTAIKDADANYRLAFLTLCQQDGMSKPDVLRKMMKIYAFYEEYPLSEQTKNLILSLGLSDQDHALPYELHDRVDRFLIKLSADEALTNNFKEQLKQSTSFNACLRNKIRSGEI